MASALTTYLCTVTTTQRTQSDTFDFYMNEMYIKIPSDREVLDIVGNLSTGTKIFETEQANLYLEAVVNVKIFAKCLSSTILQIMNQIVDISKIREVMETLFNKIVEQAKTTLKNLDNPCLQWQWTKDRMGWYGATKSSFRLHVQFLVAGCRNQ